MILAVFYDMKAFLILITYSVFAFTLMNLSTYTSKEDFFEELEKAFLVTMGDFDVSKMSLL